MKKFSIIINVAFCVMLLFSICIVFLGFNKNGNYSLYIIGGILLILGLLFNWYCFNRFVSRKDK
ncbi:hypothetical protein EGX73_00255 (plasmid) [Enterococcus sp. FDAARGOS_553]|uniref:Uncharacterized protein n=2 Tax=Vagococcus TaxID=2737 RepID=A0A430AP50_9ENTE|nr:hypothetical protein EGX73_00255 [Enterococcus sp. FDAARGOS_553]MCZ1358844.1 hypothetical protein [Enterococcus faecium]RST91681.1 hypothetical protein CBF36_09740 [Vagococcus bubulae]RSU09879.1 hypothetical protein CBF28_14375 [Vagococcus carniphilus]TFI60392.1 hypothetical protein CKN62_13835 [Carnobacterium divergens]